VVADVITACFSVESGQPVLSSQKLELAEGGSRCNTPGTRAFGWMGTFQDQEDQTTTVESNVNYYNLAHGEQLHNRFSSLRDPSMLRSSCRFGNMATSGKHG
jgi:hypothetical protein